MRLNDVEIEKICRDGAIAPFDINLLNPASLDIRVGTKHKRLTPDGFIPVEFDETVAKENPHLMMPGDRLLVGTMEWFDLPPDVEGQYYLTSSRGREFLQSMLAGYIDPGFYGILTLELINLNFVPIPLYPGKIIGQIKFDRLEQKPYRSYRVLGRYNGQEGAAESRG